MQPKTLEVADFHTHTHKQKPEGPSVRAGKELIHQTDKRSGRIAASPMTTPGVVPFSAIGMSELNYGEVNSPRPPAEYFKYLFFRASLIEYHNIT